MVKSPMVVDEMTVRGDKDMDQLGGDDESAGWGRGNKMVEEVVDDLGDRGQGCDVVGLKEVVAYNGQVVDVGDMGQGVKEQGRGLCPGREKLSTLIESFDRWRNRQHVIPFSHGKRLRRVVDILGIRVRLVKRKSRHKPGVRNVRQLQGVR